MCGRAQARKREGAGVVCSVLDVVCGGADVDVGVTVDVDFALVVVFVAVHIAADVAVVALAGLLLLRQCYSCQW